MAGNEKSAKMHPFPLHKRLVSNDTFCGYIFILPFIIGFMVFTFIPVLSSLYFSFTRYDILSPPQFIGAVNYTRIFTDDKKFYNALAVTVKYVLVGVPLKLLFALIVAMVLSYRSKLSPVYRAVYYLPSIMGGSIAVAVLWKRLFGIDAVFNSILALIGIDVNFSWIGNPATALGTLILLAVWQFGSSMLIFLAGLKQIPQSYYEAASIDGAGRIYSFFKITLPMLTPVLFFNLVMQMISGFMTFTQGLVITNGEPLDRTLFYALYMYQRAFKFYEMGYGCALAWIMLLVIAFFTLAVFRSSDKWVFYESKG